MTKEKPSIRKRIKSLLVWRDISLSKLVRKMNELNKTNHAHSNLSHKLARETVKFKEVEQIADILGYDIIFKERENWEDWEEK